MQEFIAAAADKFGISTDKVEELSGGVLKTLKEQADSDQFSELASKVPGLSGLLDKAPSDGGDSGGGIAGALGGLGGGLGGALGGITDALGGGGLGNLTSMFSGAGLDLSQGGSFVQMLINFIKEKAGSGIVDTVLDKVPALKGLLG